MLQTKRSLNSLVPKNSVHGHVLHEKINNRRVEHQVEMVHDDIGPPLASESSGSLPSTRTYGDGLMRPSSRGASAPSHRRLRQELAYPTTTQWAFLTSTPDNWRPQRAVPPSRPATAREISTLDAKIPKRPATSRSSRRQIRHHEQMEFLTPRAATSAIQEAIRRERDQETYVDPLVGRSVEPRGHTGREGKTNEGPEANTIELLSRARVGTTASMNATERLRLRAFQARANGEYDQAIKFYSRLSTASPGEVEAKFHLAVCLERTGQFAPALAAYKQVQKLSGGHAFAYYNMGNLCMCSDRVQQAIDYFSRAITTSKVKDVCSSVNGEPIGPTPIIFYRQRAAAYRKIGDFEKAAQDYVLVQKCASSEAPTQTSERYTADPLYELVKHTTSPKKVIPHVITNDEEEIPDNEGVPNQQDNDQEEETKDPLTVWQNQHYLAIARLPPSERSDRDLQYLVDFMQKRFSVCSALHTDVCRILCRELVVSPEGRLPAKTPIFMEQDADAQAAPSDKTLYFIFQGRVSISKTSGRMFQSSPMRAKRTGDVDETQENLLEEERYKHEDTWESPWNSNHSLVSTEWKQSQLELCKLEQGEIFGHQGRFITGASRTYSAVTITTCVIGALSWHHWKQIDQAQHEADRERAARFLIMTPAFSSVPATEIHNLAGRATFTKVVGSKVLCCEGQSVDGLLVVREGELCQFSPSNLRPPPDISVSFALSGSLAEPQSARVFFTQLETAGDPLSFLRVNEAFHGFLPQNYVVSKQRELLRRATTRPKVTNVRRSSVMMNCLGTGKWTSKAETVALALRRGETFCISSTWIPPHQSRQEKQRNRGVASAKAALVSAATAELLFLSSADLMQGLSEGSRSQLHRNLQTIDNKRRCKTDLTKVPRGRGAPGTNRSSNLLEQFVHDARWSKFKQELVQSVLRGRS